MNKRIAITLTASATTAFIALANLKKNHDHNEYFAETFPEFDPKLLKKAHAALMRSAFRGKLDMTNWSKEKYEEMLTAEYKLLNQ